MGVVAYGAGVGPSGVEVGEVESTGEFSGFHAAAVGDGIAFEEPRFGFDLVTSPPDRDR